MNKGNIAKANGSAGRPTSESRGVSAAAWDYVTADQALSKLRSGMRVFIGSGCATPQSLVLGTSSPKARLATLTGIEPVLPP